MERFWLKDCPEGVPADIDVAQYRALPDLLEDAFRKFADRDAFIFMDHALSYAELDRLSASQKRHARYWNRKSSSATRCATNWPRPWPS